MVKKLTTEEFIERAKKIHGDKYDYSNTNYEHSLKKGYMEKYSKTDFSLYLIIVFERGAFFCSKKGKKFGGATGIRTLDPLLAKQVL